jgi:hypothetical protein
LRYCWLQVLLHGCILSESNVEEVLKQIHEDLISNETQIATSMKDVIPGYEELPLVSVKRRL